MGISWRGSEYSLVLLPPGVFITNPPNLPAEAITQDNYLNASNAGYDIEFFNGYTVGSLAPYKYFKINNPGIGAWTYALIENTPPSAGSEPIRVYMANGSDYVLDFKTDQERYILTSDQNGNPVPVNIHLEAAITQGGESSSFGDHTKTIGEPVNDAIVSVQVTSPDGQKVVGFLTPSGDGLYSIDLNTVLQGNYDISVIASDNVPGDSVNNSQYLLTTQHSCFVSTSEEPKEPVTEFPPYALFSNQNINLGTSVRVYDGSVASNANISISGSANIEGGVERAGSFNGGTSIIGQYIKFNGSVNLGGSTHISDDVNSGGILQGGTSVLIGGNVKSGDIVNLNGSTRVNGNLDASGDITLGTSVRIKGDLTTAGLLFKSNSTIISGTITENGSPAPPETYNPVTLPPIREFSSGGQNITSNCTFSPGSYGTVNMGTSKSLNLSTGDYYFDSFSMNGSSKLNLDVSEGKIRIYVTGNVNVGTSFRVNVLNGNPEDVYLKTHGDFNMSGSTKWNGIIFCPLGKFTAGTSCIITGDVFASGDISLGGFARYTLFILPSKKSLGLRRMN